MKNTTESTFEMLCEKLIQTHGAGTPLNALPDYEFETGGLITEACKAVGYDESGRHVCNQGSLWNLTVAEFVDRVSGEFNGDGEPSRAVLGCNGRGDFVHRIETDQAGKITSLHGGAKAYAQTFTIGQAAEFVEALGNQAGGFYSEPAES